MKKIFCIIFTTGFFFITQAQDYWQQKVDFTIEAKLNVTEKTVDGFEKIVYTNNSPDTLAFIWLHVWPNAYKNDRTAFSDQLLANGNTKFYFSPKEERGYINRLDFKVNGSTAKTEDHPQHIDILKLVLPKPLEPGNSIIITTPFHVKLPFNFSRGGYDGQSFQLTQWYPKPAVYDASGWHPMPYLDQGEFYGDFGSYDVQITLPENYVVAATGVLQNQEEKEWLKTRADYKLPLQSKPSTAPNKKSNIKPVVNATVSKAVKTKTIRFIENNIHDFAFFADKDFIVQADTLQLPSGRIISVAAYFSTLQKTTWQKAVTYAKKAIRFYSSELGEYPYDVATVVQGPQSFGGGMEYPTITIIAPVNDGEELDGIIAHELGHNWFYGMLASNERQNPWMDEGMNTFYEKKYMQQHYGKQTQEAELFFQSTATNKADQPIITGSEQFSAINYGLIAYHKTSQWMALLEEKMGAENFRRMMQQYFQQWQFKHPQPADFENIVKRQSAAIADSALPLLQTNGILPNKQLTGVTVINPLKKNALQNYLVSPTKNNILVSPAIGFNSYDKLMLGVIATNYASPTSRFKFIVAPLFAAGSKSFNGIGKINYGIRSGGGIRKTDIFLNAASFTMDDFKNENETLRMRFSKLVPGLRFTLKEKDPRSTVNKFIQWKTFLIREASLRINIDSIKTPTDTTVVYSYTTPVTGRYLNQLQFVYQNFRALYPFDITLQVEQAKDFVRSAATANYFFNYAKGGGLQVRFFAGKFNYAGGKTLQKQFSNDRYHLNMTGAKGYEDYTYSDYFVGRNKFEGLANQQLMIRDGGFKVRTDLLASKTGKTDDWLTALNFTSTIPKKFNPLAVLPVNIPLKVFADVGTYAEAWDREADTDRFLFDAGLQLSLFHDALQVYVPLFYSKVYTDYFKSTITGNRFFKNISFSINLATPGLKKLQHQIDL